MPMVVHIYEVGDYQEQIRAGSQRLERGELVVLPTETVYGAAANLANPHARQRLRDLRGGPARPFTVHIAKRQAADRYLGDVGDFGRRMMRKLWPGPVAIMFDVPERRRREVAAEQNIAESDVYEGPTITLRCPDHLVASDVLGGVSGPVALSLVKPSQDSPERMNWDWLDGKVELIFDAGPTRFSKPSTILRVNSDGYQIVREGIYDQRIIERLMRTTVLFVCSGNTCRSPMAEALARTLLAHKAGVAPDQLESKGLAVASAGSLAVPGAKATPQAVDAVRDLGADLSKHRSRALNFELINQADFIFTMSRNHARDVIAMVPSAADKTAPLDPEGDIEDPIGGDASLYQELSVKLKHLIEKRFAEKQLI